MHSVVAPVLAVYSFRYVVVNIVLCINSCSDVCYFMFFRLYGTQKPLVIWDLYLVHLIAGKGWVSSLTHMIMMERFVFLLSL